MKKAILLNLFLFAFFFQLAFSQASKHPNIILIITDDQGYGDFGFTGNPYVKTPVLDQLAKESVRFENFYVSPVCAPTRSSLLTGRYSLRTGIRDTYNGGALMTQNEVTVAEMLKQANYKTGIFGKWHLGDNYPMRPMDQGFDESVIHLSGGMGQVGDFTTYFRKDSSYFDPVLWHNGKQEAYQGYCSDIFASQAIQFIEKNKNQPFFCYLAFNAPHTPLQVPDSYYQRYKHIDPSIPVEGDTWPFPKMTEADKEAARRVFAMVNNIDDNIGRLLKYLDDAGITDNTIVLFLTDNGPQQSRYVAGMKGLKGSVFRGGVRVPLLVRHPDVAKGSVINATAAHIDILPTIAAVCEVELPKYKKLDGKNLLPLILGQSETWPERSLFFYWTRRFPELYNNIALQKGDYKLVGLTSYDAPIASFELYDIRNDPFELNNLVEKEPTLAANLKKELDDHYFELIRSENLLHPPLIEVGTPYENPVFLNRNDAGGERGIWAQEEAYGNWKVHINAGVYTIRFKFIRPVDPDGSLLLETNGIINRKQITGTPTDVIVMENVFLPESTGELTAAYFVKQQQIFPFWVELERLE